MKSFLLAMLATLSACAAIAQTPTPTQRGYVKTKGRMTAKGIASGKPLSGVTVTVRGRGSVVSAANGTFTLVIPSNTFSISKVQKSGYVLSDPDVLNRQYQCSSNPLTLVLETPSEQLEDKLEMIDQLNSTLYAQLMESRRQIKELKEQNKISTEEYQQLLQEVIASQAANQTLVDEMADRYSKMDFDQLDNFNRHISECILKGQLTRADSLLRAKGDVRQRKEALDQEQQAIADARRQVEKSEAAILRKRDDIAQDCYTHFELFQMHHLRDSAAAYIAFRATLDTTNTEYLLAAGDYFKDYMADYLRARQYYQDVLRCATAARGSEDCSEAITAYLYIGETHHYVGEYEQAVACYEKALDIGRRIFDEEHADIAGCYNDLAVYYQDMGDYNKAMELNKKALEIRLKVFGPVHQRVALSYGNIGVAYFTLGDYKMSLEYHDKALQTRRQLYGEQHPEIANTYNNIGNNYSSMAQYDKAIEYYRMADSINLQVLGELHPQTAKNYIDMATAYAYQERIDIALQTFQKGEDIIKTIFGPYHPLLSISYNNKSYLYHVQEDLDAAIGELEKAAQIHRIFYGENHPHVATTLTNIAQIFAEKGNLTEAREYAMKARNMLVAAYGSKYIDVAQINAVLGNIAERSGQYDEALSYLNESVSIMKDIVGEQHDGVSAYLNNIAHVLKKQGKYQEALEIFSKVLDINIAIYGQGHHTLATDYNNLASVYHLIKQNDKARECLNKALGIVDSLSIENGVVAAVYCNLGQIETEEEHYDQAQKLLLRAANIGSQAYKGADNVDLIGIYNCLSALYAHTHEYDKAEEYARQALEICRRLYQQPHDNTASSCHALAVELAGQRRNDEAIEYAEKALGLFQGVMGESHPNVARTYELLSTIYSQAGEKKKARQYSKKAREIEE